MGELVALLEAHGVEADVDAASGQLVALARFSFVHPTSGEVLAAAVWEPIEATPTAVLAWLGY